MLSRRNFIAGASAAALAFGIPYGPIKAGVRHSLTVVPEVTYSQAMGATDTNGYVVQLPFSSLATNSATIPRQFWVDSVNAPDDVTYNGLSPYPGFQMNGSGANFQFGATGRGSINAAYGPKKTFYAAFRLISNSTTDRVGNQIFLAEGGSYFEGNATFTADINGNTLTVTAVKRGAIGLGTTLSCLGLTGSPSISAFGTGVGGVGTYTISGSSQGTISSRNMCTTSTDALSFRSGFNIAFPLCIQSYDSSGVGAGSSNPLDLTTQGRAGLTGRGARPTVSSYVAMPEFTGTITGNTLSVSNVSGGLDGAGAPGLMIGQTIYNGAVALGVIMLGSGSTWTIDTAQTIGPITMTADGVGAATGNIAYRATDNPQSPVRGNIIVRGIEFNSGCSDNNSINFTGNPQNVLWENCLFAGFTWQNYYTPQNPPSAPYPDPTKLSNNIILRRSAVFGGYSSQGGGGHPGGTYTEGTNGLVVEDCIIYHGGWPRGASRQAASFTGAIVAGTLTVSNVVGTIKVGQSLIYNGQGTALTIASGSGTTWTLSSAASAGSQQMLTKTAAYPDIFKHDMYMSFGSTDQPIVRRCLIVDASAAGITARGSLLAYNNVFIDNPIQLACGGSVDGALFNPVANFTGQTSGTVLTVSGFTAIYNYGPLRIADRIVGVGLTGNPIILNQLTGTPGGDGTYTLSISQGSIGPIAMTSNRTGYAYENPTGVDFNGYYNLQMGNGDINILTPRGQGSPTQNGRVGSSLVNTLYINNPNYGTGNDFGTQPDAAYNQPSYCFLSNNVQYHYNTSFIVNGGGAFNGTQLFTTDAGNNTNNASSSYTNGQIYAALGYASKDLMMATAIASPQTNWAQNILSLVGGLYSFPFVVS